LAKRIAYSGRAAIEENASGKNIKIS